MALRVLVYAQPLCPKDMDLSRIYHLIEIDESPTHTRTAAGQETVYKLIFKDTVELRILKLQVKINRLKVRACASPQLITAVCSG